MAKYLVKIKASGGKFRWKLEPPTDAVGAGIARRQYFDDGRTAIHAAKKLEEQVVAFRKGKLAGFNIKPESTLFQLASHFFNSSRYKVLSESTKKDYSNFINMIVDTPFRTKSVGDLRIKNVDNQLAFLIFKEWKSKSPYQQGRLKYFFNALFHYAASLDATTKIPMKYITTEKYEKRSVVWTKKEVDAVVKKCMESFETRNLGLAVVLCYEWAQRPVDIFGLKWDNIDFETETATIKQTKRGAEVFLPLEGSLKALLLKQKEDFGFQDYAVPYLRQDKKWCPMTKDYYARKLRAVIKTLGLREGLRVGDLRKTAIGEMIDAGLDGVRIKPVTGHKSVSSLSPYIKHTRSAAAAALYDRKNNSQD